MCKLTQTREDAIRVKGSNSKLGWMRRPYASSPGSGTTMPTPEKKNKHSPTTAEPVSELLSTEWTCIHWNKLKRKCKFHMIEMQSEHAA